MKLIDEIIDILSSEDVNLENALIKTKVLLHKMGEKSLLIWVNNELNGYANKNEMPEYRTIVTPIYGTASSQNKIWENHILPINHIEEELQNMITTYKFQDSVSSLSISSKLNQTLKVDLMPEILPLFTQGLGAGVHAESAYQLISIGEINQILIQIRSRLLDFLLELSDKFSNLEEDIDLKEEAKKINTEELFNHTIFGDNTTIIIGNENSNNSHQIKNNIDELFRVLKKYEVEDKELDSLQTAIDKDSSNGLIKYGKNVKDWLKKISGKAIEKNTITEVSEALTGFFN